MNTPDRSDAGLTELERAVKEIQERNRRVELDKSWETSKTRKVSIVIATYFVMVLVFYTLESRNPIKDAVVPSLGFFLSTLSLPQIKRIRSQRGGRGTLR